MKKDNLTSSFLALRDKLHQSALGFLKNDEDARDALQDTFFNLWKNGDIESDAEARNKLFAVLRNVCIDRLRRPPTVAVSDSDINTLEAPPDSGEDMKRYEAALTSGLTALQRIIYNLVVNECIEYEEIALRLNMTVEAVRMNMSRARKRIRDNYKIINR